MHRDFENEIRRSESKGLELRFLNNKISEPVYTGIAIKGEGGECLKVALVDRCTGNVVITGPEASAQVEIHAIDESFDKTNEEDWTPDEFNAKILEGRRGKLTGNRRIQLQEGFGSVDEIHFSHTGASFQKTKLMLGAKVVNLSGGVRIREAKTESFTVKDKREMSKKHYQLSPSDKVWRLENICKGGSFHEKLQREHIYTVQDFLTEFDRDSQRLQKVLGKTMPTGKFMATVKHARTCTPDKKDNYVGPAVQQDDGVMLESVGEGSCSGLQDKHDSRHYAPCANKADGSMPKAPEYECEGVASFSNGDSHTSSDVQPASSSRQESISGIHIEGSDRVEFDPANFHAPSEHTLSSFHHPEKADACNLAEVNVDDASKMLSIGNSSNPPVAVNFGGNESLTVDTYHNGTDQPWSKSDPDTTYSGLLELLNLPIHSPDYSHSGDCGLLADGSMPMAPQYEHEGVASFRNCVSHTSSDVEPASSSRQERISGIYIEGSARVEFDPTKFLAPSEDTLSSFHHPEKVDDASKMLTIGNSNPVVAVNFGGNESLTADPYHNGTDQPWSKSNPDSRDPFFLQQQDLPIHCPDYYLGDYHGLLGSDRVEFDPAMFHGPSEDTLSSFHHPEKADARNLAEVNVDDASKMLTIDNSSNPPVAVNFGGNESLTADTYHNGTDQPWSKSNPDSRDSCLLELGNRPIHSPDGICDHSPSRTWPPHTTLEHGKRKRKMARWISSIRRVVGKIARRVWKIARRDRK